MIGPLLQGVLKTNTENLQFAVVTGCLQMAKGSIFTGLNNPDINTILSTGVNDIIGFTEEEVRMLLSESGVVDHFQGVRDWYGGYYFGDSVIYNP